MQVRFTQAELTNFFKSAVNTFFIKEGNHIRSGVSERNLCGRLAIYMENLLAEFNMTGYYADMEYNRMRDGKIKTMLDGNEKVVVINCDLIVHSRGQEIPDNLIAIEMKKSDRPELEKQSDRTRLRALTKQNDVFPYDGTVFPEHVAGYRLGIYMELDIQRRMCLFEKYKGGDPIDRWVETF
jgi:hypothetical protein